MYIDHQMPDEKTYRPHGSIHDYAAELAEDAYYENDGLYAEIEVFEHQISTIKALKDKIGISIRAQGRCTDEVMNGQTVPVFRELTKARSADFVVRAGAGGKIVQVLESATDEDSESASEEQEGRENMSEVTDALDAFKADVIKTIEESFKKLPVAEIAVAEESAVEVDDDKVLEIAEALAASSLSPEGRKRVLDLHRANKKPLAELIEAEEAYVKVSKSAEVEGVEDTEAQESAAAETKNAPVRVPSRWAVKKDN